MNHFDEQRQLLFTQMGSHKQMVLSTSCANKVTSRMMSIVITDGIFYFQTDMASRKYEQIKENPNVSLCIDNLQIEGLCKELGHPLDNALFCNLFENYFNGSFMAYSILKNERLFAVEPVYIQKWLYENEKPYIETFDYVKAIYSKQAYIGD